MLLFTLRWCSMTKTKIFAKLREMRLSAEKMAIIKRHKIQRERQGRLTDEIFTFDSMAARRD